MSNLLSQEWYVAMIDEAKAIVVETIFQARDIIIRGKWQLGSLVLEHWEELGGSVRRVAQDVGISFSELDACIRFTKKFPDLEKFLGAQNKNISWHKIVHELLPEHTETKERELQLCPTCKRPWSGRKILSTK